MSAGDPYPNFSVTIKTNDWLYTAGDTVSITANGVKYTYKTPISIGWQCPPIVAETTPTVKLDFEELEFIWAEFPVEEWEAVISLVLALKDMFDGD